MSTPKKAVPATNKYATEAINWADPNCSHARMLSLVEPNKRVLEFGCSTGYMSAKLKERGCTVTGIEIEPSAAAAAGQHCDQVIVADADGPEWAERLRGKRFDVIVFGDVLEHLKDPLRVLRVARRFLRPTGFVVASIPNVAHGSLRLSLLGGEFRYRNLGLLDDTHLRFFTRETIEKMFLEAGFVISEMQRATVGILDSELNVRELGFPEEILEWVSKEPEVLTYQFVLKAALASKTKLTSTLNARVLDLTREVDELQRLLRQYQKKEAIHVELEARASDLEDKLASAQEHVAHRDNLLRVAQEQVAHRGNLLTQVSDQLRVRETEIAEHLRRSENLQGELGVFPVRMLRALLRLFKRKEERTS